MYQGVIKDEARRQAKLAELSASPSSTPASVWSSGSSSSSTARSAAIPTTLSPKQQAAVDGWVPPTDVQAASDREKERVKAERRLDFERSQAREAKLTQEQALA